MLCKIKYYVDGRISLPSEVEQPSQLIKFIHNHGVVALIAELSSQILQLISVSLSGVLHRPNDNVCSLRRSKLCR